MWSLSPALEGLSASGRSTVPASLEAVSIATGAGALETIAPFKGEWSPTAVPVETPTPAPPTDTPAPPVTPPLAPPVVPPTPAPVDTPVLPTLAPALTPTDPLVGLAEAPTFAPPTPLTL